MNALRMMLLILLAVGLVACDDDPELEIEPVQTEEVSGVGVLRSIDRVSVANRDGLFHVTLSGGGGSNLWHDYQLTMEHDEWHWTGGPRFVISDGTFMLTNTLGNEVVSGVYEGQGTLNNLGRMQMQLTWTIRNAVDPTVGILNNTMVMTIEEMADDSFCFSINGRCHDLATVPL